MIQIDDNIPMPKPPAKLPQLPTGGAGAGQELFCGNGGRESTGSNEMGGLDSPEGKSLSEGERPIEVFGEEMDNGRQRRSVSSGACGNAGVAN